MSSDSDQEGFDEYYAEMEWAAVPFDAAQREAAGEAYQVEGIPRVVVLDAATGAVVNNDARTFISEKKKLAGIF